MLGESHCLVVRVRGCKLPKISGVGDGFSQVFLKGIAKVNDLSKISKTDTMERP